MKHKLVPAIALGAIVLGCAILPAAVLAQEESSQALPVIETAGEAEQSSQPASIVVEGAAALARTPDMAQMTVECRSENASASGALNDNSTLVEAVVKAVVDAGIEEENIQPASYALNMLAGQEAYRMTTVLTVTIPDVKLCGAVADAAVEAGAYANFDMAFDMADAPAKRAELTELALADASGKAEALAAELGRQLGGVCSVEVLEEDEAMELRLRVVYELT